MENSCTCRNYPMGSNIYCPVHTSSEDYLISKGLPTKLDMTHLKPLFEELDKEPTKEEEARIEQLMNIVFNLKDMHTPPTFNNIYSNIEYNPAFDNTTFSLTPNTMLEVIYPDTVATLNKAYTEEGQKEILIKNILKEISEKLEKFNVQELKEIKELVKYLF